MRSNESPDVSLVGTGNQHQYDEIPNHASYQQQDGSTINGGPKYFSGFTSDQDNITTSLSLRRWALRIGIVVAFAVFLAIFGHKTSLHSNPHVDGDDGGKTIHDSRHFDLPQRSAVRPCQVRSDGDVRVIQTSLEDPSAHMSEIPCFVYSSPWELMGTMYRDGASPIAEESASFDEFSKPSAEIRVDFKSSPFEKRPPILGFGGAFTEAAALNYNSLNEEGKKAAMELLFGKSGLGYSMTRVHMNSCDFSLKSYAFDNVDGDFELAEFDTGVQHDVDSGMVDMIIEANAVAKEAFPEGNGVNVLVSPWSPPAWMKEPTDKDEPGAVHAMGMTGSQQPSCLRDGTGEDSLYAQSWALYFSKFITAYNDLGISIWGVTVQNEPEFPAPWEACSYNSTVESDFIEYHLGPELSASHPDVKLLAFDHNKDHAPRWMEEIANTNNPASKYVDGTAIHWYVGGNDRLMDGGAGAPNMHRLVSEVKDDHIILGSEACNCPSTGYAGGDLNVVWARAQRYAHDMLSDFAAGSNGWIEWNLILDKRGGPNHLGNLCDATILAAPHRAKGGAGPGVAEDFEPPEVQEDAVIGDQMTREELNARGIPAEFLDLGLIVQPQYYYMGHISKYVRPGSRAVKALVDSSSGDRTARTFRPKGQVVPGGGLNDIARIGTEATVWPCEGSTRQQWTFNEKGQLQVFGHDWLGNPSVSCLAKKVDKDLEGLLLTDCGKKAGVFDVVSAADGNVNLVMKNGESDASDSCIVIKPLENEGGAYGERGGAQAIIGDCSDSSAAWIYSEEVGELMSTFFSKKGGDVCLTTGWPFLQVGAFKNPSSENVVVILNEADESANYVLQDGDKVVMTSSIPAHSIQTVLL
mmetsp:Transcript_10361/g.15191  ORF Transcript_10361/g.15191 Transcript_10361/m.15191 type:complete len:863 (+) Transcript_10361:90-2678(+)|eukprot:CAMPEP_0195523586 /NCGR_PEP_ID=MMETSP0794_2-20130614/22835_1 /TAXON_ID=515487 /ORGANISM="Stephanopyxis turris, Strain CCMP 815" /LENGTH=862 /DNA_ID=CAMNT_0040653609 /DNA_START=63 /DNA_END=2651 /DNA_ORIENTATION=+